MLEMPKMIQTWKEVCFFPPSRVVVLMLISNYREVMVVDGRSGRNKQRRDESRMVGLAA
jgi:hypothetical protein